MSKKIMILVLMLGIIGIMSAKTAAVEPATISCPNPRTIVTELAGSSRNPDTLYYDDGISSNAWAYYAAGNGWGAKFTPTSYPCAVTGALFHIYDASWPVPGGTSLKVKVVDDDGTGGAPLTTIYESGVLTCVRGAWNYYDLTTQNISITSGSFYVFYIQAVDYPNCPGLSIDAVLNAPYGIWWKVISGVYTPDSTSPAGDFLLRANVSYGPPPTNDVGVDAILSPGNYHTPSTLMTPSATVKNFGTATQTSFPVVCSIVGAGLNYTNTQTVASLAGGATTTVNFTGLTPTTAGICTVKMRTNLTGDERPNNDRKTRTTLIANIYSQDFEANNGNYVADPLTGAWEWGVPTSGPMAAHSGTKVWATVLAGNYGVDNANWKLSSELYTATTNNPTLKFWQWYLFEGTSTWWDAGNVKISTNGVDWTLITPTGGYPGTAYTGTAGIGGEPCYCGSSGGWVEAEFPLTLTSGQTFYLRWHFGSDGSVSTYPGWYIDDLSGIGFQAQPPPTNDVGMYAIRAPGPNHMVNTPMSPIAVVKNFGTAAQTSFPVVCSIVGAGSVVRYTNTKTVASLAAGDTVRVNFDAWTNPTITEPITVVMRTNLTGDLNPGNDRMTLASEVSYDLINQGFEDATFPPTGWVVYNNDGGTYLWSRMTTYPRTGVAHAGCRYETSTLRNDDWLVTPQVLIPAAGATLKFWYRTSTIEDDSLEVRLSTTTNAISSFTVQLDAFGVRNDTYLEKVISLNSYANQNVYIAFVNKGLYQWTICIDDVRVAGQVGIEEPTPNTLPLITSLNAAKPNPVTNGIVHISFNIATPTHASLKIYDASGRIIRTLVNNNFNQGTYNLTWNGRDDNNRAVAEGVYFYTLETDNNTSTKKLVLTR